MSIPTYQTQSAKVNAGTSPWAVTPALPAGVTADDIVILVATTIAGGSVSITANGSIGTWTEITSGGVNVAGGEKLYAWWGRYASGSTGPTVQAGSDHIVACTFNVRGCATSGSPVEAFASGSETTSDTSYSFATGVSTSGPERLVFTIYSSGVDSNTGQGGTPANTSLGSVTLRIEYQSTSGDGGGFVVATGTLATAGSCGTWTDTMVTATPKAYISFALKPPGAQTYNEAITLGINAGQSNVANLVMDAAMTLAAEASQNNAGGLTLDSAMTLAAILGFSPAGFGELQAAITLAAATGMSPAAVAEMLASASLSASVAVALGANVVMGAAITLAATKGAGLEGSVQTGGQTYDEAIALALALSVQNLGSFVADVGTILAAQAGASFSAQLDAAAQVILQAVAGNTAEAQLDAHAGISLGTALEQVNAALLEMNVALALSITAGLVSTGDVPGAAAAATRIFRAIAQGRRLFWGHWPAPDGAVDPLGHPPDKIDGGKLLWGPWPPGRRDD